MTVTELEADPPPENDLPQPDPGAALDLQDEAPAPRRRGGRFRRFVLLLLVLVLVAALAVFAWEARSPASADVQLQGQLEQADRSIEALQAELRQLRSSQVQLEQRVERMSATHQVLREEVLGIGERSALLEASLVRIAKSRVQADAQVRLSEAESLLRAGVQRLHLHGDVATAIEAFGLADQSLAELDEPVWAMLRQTLAAELEQLRELPPDPRPALRNELASLGAALAGLPRAHSGEIVLASDASGAPRSRLYRALSRLVTVRRTDPNVPLLGIDQQQALLAAIHLQIDLAGAALVQPDEAAWRAALQRIRLLVTTAHDQDSDAVAAWLARLDRLSGARLRLNLPAVGSTLRELHSLRLMQGNGLQDRGTEIPPAPEVMPDSDRGPKPAAGDDNADEGDAEGQPGEAAA